MQSINAGICFYIREAIILLLFLFIILFVLYEIWYLVEFFKVVCMCQLQLVASWFACYDNDIKETE